MIEDADRSFRDEIVKLVFEPNSKSHSVYSLMAIAISRLPQKKREQFLASKITKELEHLMAIFAGEIENYELAQIIKDILKERVDQSTEKLPDTP